MSEKYAHLFDLVLLSTLLQLRVDEPRMVMLLYLTMVFRAKEITDLNVRPIRQKETLAVWVQRVRALYVPVVAQGEEELVVYVKKVKALYVMVMAQEEKVVVLSATTVGALYVAVVAQG